MPTDPERGFRPRQFTGSVAATTRRMIAWLSSVRRMIALFSPRAKPCEAIIPRGPARLGSDFFRNRGGHGWRNIAIALIDDWVSICELGLFSCQFHCWSRTSTAYRVINMSLLLSSNASGGHSRSIPQAPPCGLSFLGKWLMSYDLKRNLGLKPTNRWSEASAFTVSRRFQLRPAIQILGLSFTSQRRGRRAVVLPGRSRVCHQRIW